MGQRWLYAGLWIRMLVALLLGVAGMAVLLAAEFALTTVFIFCSIVYAANIGFGILLMSGLATVYVGVVWFVALRYREAELSDLFGGPTRGLLVVLKDAVRQFLCLRMSGDSEDTTVLGSPSDPPTVRGAAVTVGGVAGVGVAVLLAHGLVFTALGFGTVLWIAVASGAVITIGVTGWVVVGELRSAGSVRADLEDEHEIISAPERKREVTHRVRRLAGQADCPAPDVEIGASHLPRAASVGYRPRESVMLVSRGLVDSLDDEELDAVLAHELAHLVNRDAAVMTALAVPRAKIHELKRLERDPSGPPVDPLLIVSAPVYVVNRLAVPMVARYREFVADHAAGKLVGSHAAMASALTTLDREYSTQSTQDLRVGWSTGSFSIVPPPWKERKILDSAIRFYRRRVLGTHPPTEARIERLRARVG
jgi:heat shock protein HtpX